MRADESSGVLHNAEIPFRVESSNGAPIVVTLHWHREDPLAVIAFFPEKTRHGRRRAAPVWEFALSLMVDALTHPDETIGLGDVRVQVTTDGEMWLWLSSPTGSAVLTCEALPVAEFAQAVNDLMDNPSMTVSEQIDKFLAEVGDEVW